MNTLDIILLVPLLYGAYHGFKKGFLMEIVSLFAFVIAIMAGFKLLHLGMELLDQHFRINGKLLPYISFLLIFVAIVVGMNLLGKLIKKVIDMTVLGNFDNLAGALLGLLKWSFGISVLLWLTSSFNLIISEEQINESQLYGYIEPIAPVIVSNVSVIMPFTDNLFDAIHKLLSPAAS